MSFGMSMFSSLRGSDFEDLAWELVLSQNVHSFSKLTSLDWITKGTSFLLLEIFFGMVFFLGLTFRGHLYKVFNFNQFYNEFDGQCLGKEDSDLQVCD
jgi:hypothetical protein